MLDAAPAYSAFAGILGGFVFLAIITLMAERRSSVSSAQEETKNSSQTDELLAQNDKRAAGRVSTLRLFLPALLSLLVSSFLFGEVSGEQVCDRGYVEGLLTASLLAVGASGVFSGIVWMLDAGCWMLDAYDEPDENLRHSSVTFTQISFFIVVALLSVSGVDIADDAYNNNPPSYVFIPLIAYGPVLVLLIAAVREWFMPGDDKEKRRAQLSAVYTPALNVLITVIIYSVLTSYAPAQWHHMNNWKTFVALGVSMFFPAVTMLVYIRSLPDTPYDGPLSYLLETSRGIVRRISSRFCLGRIRP